MLIVDKSQIDRAAWSAFWDGVFNSPRVKNALNEMRNRNSENSVTVDPVIAEHQTHNAA
jgi:hypothetical protein